MQSSDEGRLDDEPLIIEESIGPASDRPATLGTSVVDRYLEAPSVDGSTGPRPVVDASYLPDVIADDGLYRSVRPVRWWPIRAIFSKT